LGDERKTHPHALNKRGRSLNILIFIRFPPQTKTPELYESDWIEGTVARSIVKDTTMDFFVKKKMMEMRHFSAGSAPLLWSLRQWAFPAIFFESLGKKD
jgi:hypothetical protein